MKKVAFYTLGCKVNQYETEAMRELFEKDGYISVKNNEIADVYVINTCTVTSMGDRKSRQFIRKSKRLNPKAIVVVVGCYSQISPGEIMNIEGVNLVIGTDNRKKIIEFVKNISLSDKISMVSDIMKVKDFEELTIDNLKNRTRAFLKIQEGCNQYCTYCIIPYSRGHIRSRNIENIKSEVERLSEHGFKEIVLTGIHIASYGRDMKNYDLIDAVKICSAVEGIQRVRVSSVEPRVITDEFLSEIVKIKEFCPHFHLSLQSGSDSVLKRMNRKYNTEEYFEAVEKIKKYFKGASITTDIIVGFPGESDAEFLETIDFIKKINFFEIHVFKYSKRRGTVAANMDNQISAEIKDRRSHLLIELAKKMEEDFIKSFLGKKMDVLFESRIENNLYLGHTVNYLKVVVSSEVNIIGKIEKINLIKCKDNIINGIME